MSAVSRPRISKRGTIDCDMVETTPVVFDGRLYRFEYVRPSYPRNPTGAAHFRFVDVETGQITPAFAANHHLGCAFVEGDVVYAYGVADRWGRSRVDVFWSTDLVHWSSSVALDLPGWGIFNTSVCRGADGYIMAIEIDAPPEEAGVRFTIRFARSDDLRAWHLTPSACVYAKDRYTACPALRYLDGAYYMIYLEACPGPTYESHIVRSPDLMHWERSPLNPVLRHSDEDRNPASPTLSQTERARIATAVNINNSDVDLCEFGDRTVLYYSWGNQHGIEHLAEAEYAGPLAALLRGFFPSG